jgi:type 1 fimbriae regulatory protein FimB
VERNKPRSVKSLLHAAPVDAYERTRDYLSEAELLVLLQRARDSRYRWRNTAMLLLTFGHGLRASELCHPKRQAVDTKHGRIWIKHLKGSLSREQPLRAGELRALQRCLAQRSDSQVPWPFLTERGYQFTRYLIDYLGESPVHVPVWRFICIPICCVMGAATPWPTVAPTSG